MIAVLKNRNFTFIWLAGLISMMGNWVLLAALPFYIYDLTGSALATAGVFMAFMLPGIFLGSIAGVFVDRWSKLTTMLIVNLLQIGVVLVLTVAQTVEMAWVVYLVLVIEASIAQFFGPAENALLPRLVAEKDLVAANSLNSMNDNIARLIAPAVGGLVLAVYGFTSVVLIDALTYLVAAALILVVWLTYSEKSEKENTDDDADVVHLRERVNEVLAEWWAGFQLVRAKPILSNTFVVIAIALLADAIITGILVIFLQEDLGMGSSEFGYVMTARGIGGLLGAVLLGQFGERFDPRHILSGSLVLLSLTIFVAVLWIRSLTGLMSVMVIGGMPAVGMFVAVQTIFQKNAPEAYLGRVFGLFQTVLTLLMFFGYLFGGLLGEAFAPSPIMLTGAVIYIFAALLGIGLMFRPGTVERREAIDYSS